MKRLIGFALCLVLLVAALGSFSAFAAEAPAETAQLQFSAAKNTYKEGQQIKTTLKLKNDYPYPITNLQMHIDAPAGYSVHNPEAFPTGKALASGKEITVSLVLAPGTPEGKAPGLSVYAIAAIVTAVLALGVLTVVLVILAVKKKKKLPQKSALCLILVLSLLFGLFAMPLQVSAADVSRHRLTQSIPVTVGETEHTVTAHVSFDYSSDAGALLVNTANLGYREALDAFLPTLEFDGIYGTLQGAKNYSQLRLQVYDGSQTLIWEQSIPAAENWKFPQVGLCPGMNRVVVQAVGSNILTAQLKLYDPYGLTYHLLEGAETDTDGEGLFDLIERSLGTDIQKPDTDGDGLTDYDEVCRLDTDPLKADSDENGVDDSHEDRDGDGISNGQELNAGLSPILRDTDRDGLTDQEERKKHKTDPLKPDTDGDGAEDGWEVLNGYNPRKSDKRFSLSAATDPVSTTNPVSAEVKLQLGGKEADLDSLSVTPVTNADHPFISQCIAGSLGQVVDISLDGDFDSATLTFRYDTSLGKPGKDFQPRIYHFNELTQTFEELENQTVKNGVVTAKTTHFSVFGLFNKAAWDNAFQSAYEFVEDSYAAAMNWVEQTKAEREAAMAALASADIAFVMDNSASMAWSDPARKSREVTEYFIRNIRPGYDKAAILSYAGTPQMLQDLTADTQLLQSALDRITLDNGVSSTSGTKGAAAITSAVELLCKGAGSYRYVVFFSDGDDTSLDAEFNELASLAKQYEVRFICVQVGPGKNAVLEKLAAATDGAYYTVNQATSVEDTFDDALDIFDAITPTVEDSNGDGINDFVNQLIHDGKLPLSNGSFELMGADFNYNIFGEPSADWDGDGLKNGDEIHLRIHDGKACMVMDSNPFKFDSDRDGFTDKEEVARGMDPLRNGLEKKPMDVLLEGPYYHSAVVNKYDPDAMPDGWGGLASVNEFFLKLDGFVFAGGSWNREEIYQELIAEYYYTHSEDAMGDAQTKRAVDYILAFLDGAKAVAVDPKMKLADTATNTTFVWDFLSDVHEAEYYLSHSDLPKEELEKLCKEDFMKNINSFLSGLEDKLPIKLKDHDVVKKLFSKVEKYTGKISEASEALGKLGDIMTFVEAGVDLYETVNTFAKVEADCAIFLNNLDALEYVAKFSSDEYAAEAANLLIIQITGSFGEKAGVLLCSALRDAAQLGVSVLMDFAAKIPYVGTFVIIAKAVVELVGWISGTEAEVEATYRILCYHEMATVYTKLLKGHTANAIEGNELYLNESGRETYRRYALNLGKIRRLGEEQYIQYYDACYIGGLSDLKKEMQLTFDRIDAAMTAIRTGKLYKKPFTVGGGSF